MKVGKYTGLEACTMALGLFIGQITPDYSLAQSKGKMGIPPPKEGQIGIRTTKIEGRFCGPYIEEEHWDGRKTPKIIAYYETKEQSSPSIRAILPCETRTGSRSHVSLRPEGRGNARSATVRLKSGTTFS